MNGIFQYSTHFNDKFQTYCSLDEGNTPLLTAANLARALGMYDLYLKDETQNPSKSFKDRATAYQLSYYTSQHTDHFVISSSGNAAVSVALYANAFHVYADIFISSHIPQYKLKRLEDIAKGSNYVTIHKTLQPKKEAIQYTNTHDYINLTGSKDSMHAIAGYKTLGYELMEQINEKPIDAFFMPTSSGTGLRGLAEGFSAKTAYYAIQTTKKYLIAKEFDKTFIPTETSLASAIVANVIPQKTKVISLLKESNGGAYAISDTELEHALAMAKQYEKLNLSYDSALALAGLIKALQQGKKISSAVCILTGV